MNDHYYFLQQVDDYLDGKMLPAEEEQFERLCREDEEAKSLFNEQRIIRKQLEQHADRDAMKSKVKDAAREWDALYSAQTASSPTRKQSTPVIPMRRLIWKVAGIAAAVTLLITAGGFWITQNYNDHKISSYTVLRREIDNIKRSQSSMLHDINKVQKTTPVNPGQYGGTGFAISGNGYLATNVHVIKGADSIYVQTSKGDSYKATLVYEDRTCDLAILKIQDSTFKLPPLPYVLRKTPAPLGDEVYTLGYPRDEIVYGKGYISSETGFRGDTNSYQIAIPVNPGNSGGPLIDSKGQVLGIITGKESPSDDVAFAVKSSFLMDMLDSLPREFNKSTILKSYPAQSFNRVDQIKRLQPYIFLVKVYN